MDIEHEIEDGALRTLEATSPALVTVMRQLLAAGQTRDQIQRFVDQRFGQQFTTNLIFCTLGALTRQAAGAIAPQDGGGET